MKIRSSLIGLCSAAALWSQSAEGPGCAINPAAPSVGADVPITYFAPPPSVSDPKLVGPLQLLTAGTLDANAGTLRLPLYQGRMRDGRAVWYVLTDTTDEGNAKALGLNFSPKLNFAATGRGVRTATLEKGGVLIFEQGTVDFAPARRVVPGPAASPFPPVEFQPGSTGDRDYTPLVRITNAGGHIYNAPIIAFGATAAQITFPNGNPDYTRVHDKVLKIDPAAGTVTLLLIPGFSFAKPVLYLSMDASARLPAAMEGVTMAPGMTDIDVGNDDSAFSAVERLFAFINGPRGCGNPHRQGFESALVDGRSPLNVLGGIPFVANDYSPLWDVNLGEWTGAAINAGYRARLTEEFQILSFAANGFITGPGGMPYGSAGFIVNCPIVFRFL